jgi:hypothetical protein
MRRSRMWHAQGLQSCDSCRSSEGSGDEREERTARLPEAGYPADGALSSCQMVRRRMRRAQLTVRSAGGSTRPAWFIAMGYMGPTARLARRQAKSKRQITENQSDERHGDGVAHQRAYSPNDNIQAKRG